MPETYAELTAVNVMRELDRLGWAYDFAGDDELKCKCPAHADKSPSCSVSVSTKYWKCHSAGCGKSGDFLSFMALILKSQRAAIVEYVRQEYGVDSVKSIDPTVVERYHEKIWGAGPLLAELRKRGISDDSIREFRLGVDASNRITIPVHNETGTVVNIRRYRPGAPSKEKMKNTRGMGKIRLYPVSQLKYEVIILTGGECKAIVTAQELNQHEIGAICATAGEDNWDSKLSLKLRDKRVFICYDIDQQGRAGAEKVAARVKTFAAWVGVMSLPLDADKYPAGDVNDYFGQERKSPMDFLHLMDETVEWEAPKLTEDSEEGEPLVLPLAAVTQARYTKQRITTRAVITAMDTTPYLVPRSVECECDKNQAGCAHCPVYGLETDNGFPLLTLSKTSPAILELVNAGKATAREAIREGLKIPPCKTVSFHTKTHYNVEDVRLSPQLEISSRASDSIMLPALTVSHGLEMNVAYKLTGRPFPHPRTQQAILLVGESEPAEDALDTYEPTEEELEELKLFQPTEWTPTAIHTKLKALYEDFSANVTRIFDRFDLHLFIDLVYHSPMLIPFDGRIEKGWVEGLCVGDSAQGKSEATKRLMEHYSLGEKVEVKNASVAGLLGGLAQLGNRWMVQWGVIPRHDRRLVVLEELKGASTEMIGRLTDMRSSGVAEIDKIEKRRTHARTRLLALSNPRTDLPLAAYSYGVEAVRELIGGPEDLRRFDIVLVVSSAQVDPARLNVLSTNRPVVEHLHTADLSRRLVLWTWSRREEQIRFEPEAEIAVLNEANALCETFTDVIPIIDRGSTRYKIARLATALAGRTASFDTDVHCILVREAHVKYIADTLRRMYSDPVMGYAAFSEAYKSTRRLNDPHEIKKRIFSTPFPDDFLEQMLHTDAIELRDMCDWTGWERNEATDLLSFLVRKHALIRENRAYRKNPAFIELMRELLKSADLAKVIRPEYVKERGSSDEF